MKIIPRFSYEDTAEIELLLVDKGIPFESESVHFNVSSYGSQVGYLFHVPDEHYQPTIKVIREFYGLIEQQEQNLENCPACGSKVIDQHKCSECGLSLSYSPEESMGDHPFYIYLKQQNLI